MTQYAVKQDYSAVDGWQIDLEKEMINTAASTMAKDIDFEVLASLFEASGWTRVYLNTPDLDINEWCDARGINYITRGQQWVFEDARYATMFRLKWSS